MLEAAGHTGIPLGAGQDGPVGNGLPFPDWIRQLSDDFWNYPLPNAGKTYPVRSAPELIVDTINQSAEPVTMFMSGTFTSLAQALRIDPGIREKMSAVFIMGGAVFVPGNITNLIPDASNKVAEWNLVSDPVAAAEVFDAGLEMYLVPLDATNKVIFEKGDIEPWHEGDQKARFSADLYDIMFDEYGWAEAEIFDLGAAVIMIEPDACEFVPLHLDVITEDGDMLGQTVDNPDAEPNINVCLDPDADLIMQVLNDVFSGAPGSSDPPGDPSIDPVAGSWSGIVVNDGLEMEITITVDESCRLGSECGRFEIETIACSGVLSWVGMDGERYEFEASELTETCGEGSDYLSPRADGTVEYHWKGDSGEATGILRREP
jgi:purine nucleosidase/pyrimidine-specific ribonucleoside hydrolase